MEWFWTLKIALASALMIGGVLIMLIGSIGINRLPDFYSRTHAAANVDTLGILLFVGGLTMFEGWALNSAKLMLITLFILLTSPIASHALARRAMLAGLVPWFSENSPGGPRHHEGAR